jgi:ABC-type transport system substrate-binding protein
MEEAAVKLELRTGGRAHGVLTGHRTDRRRLLQGTAALGMSAALANRGRLASAQSTGGTLNVAWAGDLVNLISIFSSSGQEQALSSLISGTLIKPNDNLEPIADLAESWEASPDASVYTFKLRPNLVWSDGQPLTADDVLFTYERAIDRRTGSERAGTFLEIKGADAYASQAAERVEGLTAPDPLTRRSS